ncbi:hypothetical protein [Variovorax paradoxus]|nr:hypothetical protein [Variovorax paradoxus]
MQENLSENLQKPPLMEQPMAFDAPEPISPASLPATGASGTAPARPPAPSKPLVRRGTGAAIYQAIVDLGESNKVATRQVLMELLGLPYSIIDDHVKRMIEDGRLRRVVHGVFEAVPPAAEDRAVSMTFVPGGGGKLEVGDACIDLTLRELRMVGLATAGVVMQFGREA